MISRIMYRREAQELGLDKYFTGRRCKAGHVSERYVSSRGCIVCAAASDVARRAADPVKHARYHAAHYAANRERIRARAAEHYAANRERISAKAAARYYARKAQNYRNPEGIERALRNGLAALNPPKVDL